MSHVAITLEYGHQSIDLALPMQVPSRLLVEGLVQALKLPKSRGHEYVLSIKSEVGLQRISPNASLGDMLIVHGMRLTLLEEDRKEALVLETGARLRAADGLFFPLKSKITVVGRNDPKSGIFVDVDLTALAPDPRVISRKHAQIEQEGDRFYIVDLGSTNGTRLNGQRLPPHEKKPLWEGDVIEFGKKGVTLILQVKGQSGD